MNALSEIQLVNLLGFAVGAVLYGLLLLMTLRYPVRKKQKTRLDFLLLATAALGLLWNACELVALIAHDFNALENVPLSGAISHSALGFLPAVIVHFTLQNGDDSKTERSIASDLLIIAAYCLSSVAAILHFRAAIFSNIAPSQTGLQILIFGYLAILGALVLSAYQQTVARKTVLAATLAIFAISALHLSHSDESGNSIAIEIIGHQASLPLALAILYEDFRFAFADLFLKRALSLLFLTLTVFGLYVFLAAPLMEMHKMHSANDSQPTFILLGFWILTALIYPQLHHSAVWLVDKILLRRVNYESLRRKLAEQIEKSETTERVLEEVCETLAAALTAKAVWRRESPPEDNETVKRVSTTKSENILVPTAESPFFQINLHDFRGGRRLLSEETEMLQNVAVLTARRIDALRVTHERCEQEIREQEIGKLASEAELRALRAQLNPHFLFNALTTIGYLIDSAPDKALETLLQLTQLLRGVLRASGEFSTLGDELKLIEAYLEIERARFEERLQVKIEVAPELRKLRIPSLILQPLVENAVKHGISPQKNGGEICLGARMENENLILTVSDTGAGVNDFELPEKRSQGVGLQNIEARLGSHYGEKARLKIESRRHSGTTAQISLPCSGARANTSPVRI